MTLAKLRHQINNIDKKIVNLLNLRAKVILGIAELKKKTGRGIYAPSREREVLDNIRSASRGLIPLENLEAIYREIMSCSLSLEKPLKIAYLGPEATFTHSAALKKFGSQVEYISCNTITDIFAEVERDNADYGVVPIENSIEGAVSHTLDMLVDSDLKICAQLVLDVSHNLLAKCPKNKIKRVYSNPQVFGQCRIWLQENLAQVDLIDVSSTSRAAQIASRQKDSACIASLLAAKVYNLKVIAKDIEDIAHNVTRFLVISKTDAEPTGIDKTSIIFSIKDRVGALHDMLVPFKKYKLNLTKIESRPSKRKAWDYYFFVDLEGHRQDKNVKKALTELDNRCKFLKILGSYPRGE
jgi:chorismate mutase/prephenate dehydratase